MLRSALRILVGFAAACLVAGATQVLFVVDPAGIFASRESAAAAGLLTAMAATQAATFALPFAVIAVGVSEIFGLRGWLTFTVWGVLIALSAFATVVAGEGGDVSLRNSYALWAFIASGAVAGLTYWLIAGRAAGYRAVSV
ncbi:MAG: hypothetical protein C0519_00220 [Hyphomicrobium sp.]|jgi:hypothetical protein|nr:hypothetical protein [Hyphomicrobium sp.]PPD08078.1 MAG: hypothetical protein CTY28_07340 [Hyphomicrobium sp.]